MGRTDRSRRRKEERVIAAYARIVQDYRAAIQRGLPSTSLKTQARQIEQKYNLESLID